MINTDLIKNNLKDLNIYNKNRNKILLNKLGADLSIRFAPIIYDHAYSKNLDSKILKELKAKRDAVYLTNSIKLGVLDWISENSSNTIILLKNDTILSTRGYIRGSSDLDILIEPDSKNEIENLLKEKFRKHIITSKNPFDGLYQDTWISKQNSSIIIDLHWNISYPVLFPLKRVETRDVESKKFKILSPEYKIIHLITHIIKDADLCHYSILDICHTVNNNKIDENKLIKISIEGNCYIGMLVVLSEIENMDEKVQKLTRNVLNVSNITTTNIRKKAKNLNKLTIQGKLRQVLFYWTLTDSKVTFLKFVFRYFLYYFHKKKIF